MSEAPFRSPNAIGMELQNIVAIPPLPRLEAKRPSVAPIAIGTIALLIFFFFIVILTTGKLSSLKIFSDRSPQKVTELGTSGKTLAELSSPSAMQELEGGKYLCSELDGVEHLGWIAGLDPRVIGSGRGRKQNPCLKALQHQKLVPTCSLARRRTQSARPM